MSQSKTMRMPDALCARIEAHAAAHGLASFAAAAVDLIERGLQGPGGSAVLDALPKGPPLSPVKGDARADLATRTRTTVAAAPAKRVKVTPVTRDTQRPPPVKTGADVGKIDLPIGRERPAFGSMLKGGSGGRGSRGR